MKKSYLKYNTRILGMTSVKKPILVGVFAYFLAERVNTILIPTYY